MFPASTNEHYTGPIWASYALLLVAAQSLIGGHFACRAAG